MKQESHFIVHKNRQRGGMYSRGMQRDERAQTFNKGIFANVLLD